MKFLKIVKNNYVCCDYTNFFLIKKSVMYFEYDYTKQNKKKRKVLLNIRPGISKNISKNSIKRDFNNLLIQQYININQKNGNKIKVHKNINLSFENIFLVFNKEINSLVKFSNYINCVNLFKNNFFYFDFNFLIKFIISDFKSIFEIKTSKNNKKIKSLKKYSHEIIYIPAERRLKYVIKSLSFYKEHFKNYNLWERIFWSFFMIIVNKNKSFLKKRREYIYIKSIKFFKKKGKKF